MNRAASAHALGLLATEAEQRMRVAHASASWSVHGGAKAWVDAWLNGWSIDRICDLLVPAWITRAQVRREIEKQMRKDRKQRTRERLKKPRVTVSLETLERRAAYGGRKGRSAQRKLTVLLAQDTLARLKGDGPVFVTFTTGQQVVFDVAKDKSKSAWVVTNGTGQVTYLEGKSARLV